MAELAVVPVSRFLDERGFGPFQIKLLVWSILLVLIDGYDIGAIAFAAPHLIREWHIAPHALGPVFSASLVGILFGSALFGFIGDRYGRKAALIWSNLLFGVFTFGAAYATNLDQMFWLRLLAGIGIGGVDRQEHRRLALRYRFHRLGREVVGERGEFARELEEECHLVRIAKRGKVVDDLGKGCGECAHRYSYAGASPGSSPTAMGTRTALPHSVHDPS
mgnify:CR=1 FL=1